ncbi:KTSC domain-containing protein [Caulobacter sp. LjRoot300]|uniref:KTSC domain-containing protein n=1 Tax=Caulobacter sp. LjRoot300 TaxID=3342321 RepID=UPI003ECD2F0F
MRVDSTAIRRIDYEPEHGKLFVTFIDGDEYVYVGVPARVTEAFERAPSKGRFFQRMIRDRYPYNRV